MSTYYAKTNFASNTWTAHAYYSEINRDQFYVLNNIHLLLGRKNNMHFLFGQKNTTFKFFTKPIQMATNKFGFNIIPLFKRCRDYTIFPYNIFPYGDHISFQQNSSICCTYFIISWLQLKMKVKLCITYIHMSNRNASWHHSDHKHDIIVSP